MKKLALVAMTAAAALATPAMAQTTTPITTTGTIIINGSVTPKCSVVPNNAGNTWGTTVSLGELAQADGTLATDLASRFTTIGATGLSAKVVCTSADADVTVDAEPLVGPTGALPGGYTNTIHYIADVTFNKTDGPLKVANDSNQGATSQALGGRLAPTNANITVATNTWRTLAAGDLLIAGAYTGRIVVTVAPK